MINQTLASIATGNPKAVHVFEKYNLDFCCKGNKSLADACAEKGLASDKVIREIESASESHNGEINRFAQMSVGELIDHIVKVHHQYVKESAPWISAHLAKVARKHGSTYPYLFKVEELFGELQNEFMEHMKKEELFLFPGIRSLENRNESDNDTTAHFSNFQGPIQVMELEHVKASEFMEKIKELTHQFEAPAGACTTFQVTLEELKEFESDMHLHVHLENNILFKKAQALAASGQSSSNSCSL